MSKLYKLMTVLSCLLLLALFTPLNATFAQTCTDGDGDGYGLNGDASCPNTGVDCDDTDVNVYPDAPLLCDAKDNNCDGWIDFSTDKDEDGDGVPLCTHWQTGLKDCDDNNANRFPGNIEGPFGDPTCSDGIDNDCNNRTDSADNGCSVNCNDIDGDGYGSPGNVTCPNGSALDCNNTNAAINPGAPDAICNGVDNNCSGTPDDEYVDTPTNCGVGECGSSGLLTCSGGVEVDTCTPGAPIREICPNGLDDDCDGIPDASDPACGSCSDNDLDGYGFLGDASCANGTAIDCDDDNPAINPGAADDVCDGVDANCSGTADDEYTPTVTNCGIGECATTGLLVCTAGATVDNCSPLAPGVEGPFGDPTCDDLLDNDCDGLTDTAEDNDCNPLDQDNDGDGYCEVGPCQNPANLDGDCDDTDLNTYPGAPRLCDAIDNDCDGWQDFFTDKDVDGDGVTLCTHWQTGLKDCDDNNANRFPGNIEGPFGDPTCTDLTDNDCDNKVDAADIGCSINCSDNDNDGYGSPGNVTCPNGNALDCNDNNNLINPGESDANCDDVDNNCSGTPDDEYVDTPTNCGVGACADTGTLTCSAGVESDSCTPGTPVVEGPLGDGTCSDTSDNDCDGTTDALDTGCQSLCLDDDGDGYGLYGHASCTNAGVDCNDSNININPGAADGNCDNVDDNCSGTPDDEYTPTVTNCGIGECATTGLLICTAGATVDNCSPLAPGVEGPFGDPTCGDTLDNDCDTFIDGADIDCNPLDVDNDGDGFCEVGPCQNPANLGGDCNDADVITYPGAPRVCDAVDNDCDGWQDFFTDKDVDGDGVTLCTHWQTGLKDCDDNNADRFPGNIEEFGHPNCVDGIDNDCNNKIDNQDLKCLDQCNDSDGDGYGIPGHPSCTFPEEDCNDSNNLINPGAADTVCDGVDDNCSGTADDGYTPTVTNCGVGECATTGQLLCNAGVLEDDCTPGQPIREICPNGLDDDCDGIPDASDPACGSCSDNDLDGYGFLGDPSCTNAGVDCDDDNALINPGAADDVCDGVDYNCSGTADDEYTPTVTNCGVGECATTGFMNCNAGVLEDDCTPLPAGVEDYLTALVCTDTLDNDCDGLIDQVPGLEDPGCNPEDVDNDGDGYCEVGPCQNPANLGGDCDDTDPIVHPGGSTTICDAKDTNCDGWIDFFTDKDVDEDGVPLCIHWQTGLKDCDDNDPARYPGNKEGPWVDPTCFDSVDNDCSNEVDGLDPKCIEPTCATKTGGDFPPDGPHMFDLLDGNDNVLKTPCQWCHFNDAGTVDERTKCERCHADAAWGGPDDGTLKAIYTDPPPYGFGTASNVKKHSSTVVGTTHGAWDMECITCHNPHLQEMNYRYETTYGKYIREKICFDNVVTSLSTEEFVEFTANEGPGSFADGPPHNENICEICHTLTTYHLNDGSTVVHEDGNDCTTCHSHLEGFAPPVGGSNADVPHDGITDCTLCHSGGDYIAGATLDNAKCLACHDGVTAIEADTHYAPTAANCTDCHNPMRAQTGNASHIKTSLAVFAGGAGSFVNGSNNGICQTCHTATEHHQNDGTAPSGQNHNDATVCTTCHTHPGTAAVGDAFTSDQPAATPTLPGSHDGQACDTCHDSGSYVDGFAIPNGKCTTCHDGVTAVEADAHFAAGQGSTCVECHNPMNDQAPNVKHVRTNLAVFTGGAGSFVNGSNNGICQTCHTATEHHQNDGTAPSGQNHNDATVCTSCHTHPGTAAADDGFRDHEGTQPPLPGSHAGQACDSCHDSGTYVTGAAIANGKCTTCHDGVTAIDADAHFAAGLGSTCVECHNPMSDQSPNVDHIRTSLATFLGGAGSFVNGSNNGICQTCHTATNHHQNDGSAPGGQSHNDGLVCTGCHTHPGTGSANDAFRDHNVGNEADGPHNNTASPGLFTDPNCLECHNGTDDYVPGAAIPNSKCLVCHDGTPSTEADAHFAAGQGTTCVECHNPMSAQGSNASHIRTSLAVFTGGAGSFVNGGNNGICQTCHTATEHHQNDGTAPSGQNHNDGTVCTTCHTHAGTGAADDGFRDHEGTVTLPGSHDGQACDTCHDSGSYVDGFAIPNAKCTTCHDGVTAVEADAHFAAAQGSTCVECHNPMNDQAPNVKHVRTSLAVFTGGAGSFVNGSNNGICQTCHTATEHHQNDGTAPSGQNHNDAAVCTTCHMHAGTGAADDGFRDHEGTVTLPGSHNGQACDTCHDSGSYVDGFAIPNAKCTTCHDGVTALEADTHWPAGQGSTCVECHNPMNDQSPNVKHVRTSLAVFTGGAGSFVNGSNNGICQTCHTATEHHQNDGSAPSGQNHNDATVCTTCHTHPGTAAADDGFRDHEGTQPPLPGSHAGQACDSCHDSGTYVTGAAIANGKCKNCHDGVTAVDADAHFAAGLGSTCVECHNPMSDQSPNADHIRTSLATFLGGAGSFVNGSNNGICQTCHTATNHHQNDGSAPGGQSHNDGLVCTGCHTHPGTGSANDAFRDHNVGNEADGPHNNTASPGLFTDPNCLECHNGTDDYVPGAAIPNSKCLVCHDGTPSTEADAHFAAGQGTTCVECHNPMSAQGSNASHIRTSLAVFTGGAGSFVNGGNNGICQTCHTATEHHQNDGTAPSGQNHNDGTVCTTCHTHAGTGAADDGFRDHEGTVTLPGSHDGQACDTCHDSGSYVDGFAIPNAKCTTCHDGVTAVEADAHFAAAQGSTCVECHNPMNDQAPNVKHVRTSLAVFTGGAGSFVNGSNNGICQTCHTATEHHQNDGTAPSGQNHNDAAVCTTCHMHAGTGAADDGFRDHEGTVTLPGSHNGQACDTCHDSGSYVDGFAIPNAKCTTCHDGVTALEADTHWPAGQGSTCVECHNPMNDQSPNVKHVRTSLAVFTGGAGSFVNGSNNGICQTCHTATEHHQNDGSAPSGQNHNDATVCTTCHTHPGTAAADDGFRDHEGTQPPLPGSHAGQACDSCHDSGTYVTGAAIANGKCKNCHDGVTAVDADAHFAAGLGSTCVECHNPMSDQSPNADHIRTSLATFLGGAGSFVNGSNNGICQTCHTATNHHQNDGSAPGGQSHNDGLVCTGCHTHPGTGSANDAFRDHNVGNEADGPHNNTASPGLFTDPNCLECHNGTDDYVPGAAIPNAKCLVCHDGTPSTEADAHFGAGLGMTCVECHNPMSAQGSNASHIRTSLAVFTGGAGSFVNGGNNGICQTCHTATEHHQNDGTAPSGQNHNDGTVCTTCHTHAGTGAADDGFRDHEGTVTLPGSHDGQACDTCHDSGSYVDGFAIPNAKCTTCHDGVTAVEADAHFAAAQGSTCVECHNPMNDQAPNVKHVRTSLAVFTGGAGSFVNGSNNGICQTCHTATEHHQNDGTAPSGQNHNDATVCTTCHMHAGTGAADDGFRDHEGTVTLPGSHNGQACDTCHDSGSYVDGFAIPNAKCTTCHDGVTALEADTHWPAGQGSTCVECHNPMNDQAPNVKHVRTSLAVFTGGAGSFVNGSNNGICQTCHTATEHHQNDGTAPSGQNHNDATVCTTCHTHPGTAAADDGFRDHEGTQPPLPGSHAGQACDSCHDSGTYVTGAAIANGKCKNCHDGVTAVDADAHFAAGLGSTCVECHNPMSDQSPNADHIRTSLATFLGGAGSFVNGSNNGICQTCHTATNHHQNDGSAPGGQSHNDGLVCTGCHTHPGTGSANDAFRDHNVGNEADGPHNNTASPGLFTDPNCLECHNGTDDYVPGAAIPNSKCLVCHDGTPSTEADAHFAAGQGTTCVECHNPMSAQGSNASHIRTSLAVFTGGAGSFVNGSNNGICQTCHTATEHHQNDGTAPSGQNHNDATVCTTCHTHPGTGAANDGFRDHEGTVTLPGTHNGQACTTCHDSGTYVDGAAIPNGKCTTCHDGVTAVEADAHFAAGQGSTCVECHNPMNDQAPNVKHVRTSLAVFTGGAGSFVNGSNNGICQTCHTATEHHQNDGTAPSGQNHNDATVCTTCHTHPGTGAANDGFRDHEGTVTLPGTHNGQACTTCHDSGTYVDGAAIPNAKCATCHDGVTAVEADAHFAAAQGSTCVECHNPMNDQAPNVKHVRTSLAVFTGGAGSFVNGSNNGICQTCHTATEHHQNDGTAPSGQNHNDATVCTTCHTHPGTGAANDGFRDHEGTVTLPGTHNGQACTTCHDSGTYVDGAAIPNAKCTTCHDGVTAVEADAHFAAAQGSTCVECHNPMNDQAPNVKHVRTSLAVFTGGAGSFVNGSNNGICQTCHTATEHHQNDGTAPSGQNHNDATVCTTCHTHPGTGAANDGFRDHEGTVTLPGTHNGQACTTCHDSGTYVDGAAIPNAKCTTCHDGVTAVEADAHFAAGQGSTCVECHNPMNDQAPNVKHVRTSLAVFTGGAGSFVNGGNNGICQTCHTATEHHQNDGTAPSGQNHNDATVCTTCHTHPGTGAANDGFRDHEGTVTLPGTHNGQACTTCHDSGTYVDGAAIPNGKCTTCHDGVTAVEADAHFAAAQGSTCVECHNPMNDQAPNVKHVRTSLAVFTGGAGSFVNGSNNGICQTCHTATEHHQNDGTAPSGQNHNDATVCTTCHTHPGTGAANDGFRDHEGTVTLPGTHNGQACTTCHDSGTYVDGAAIPNGKCTTCHDGVTAVEADAHFAAAQGSTCVECHNPMNDQAPNVKHVRTSLAVFTGGAGSFVNGSNNGICQTCHTATEHHQNDGTAPSGQNHNDATVCTTCHTHPGTGAANDGFRDHEGTVTLPGTHNGQACTTCHDSGTYVDGAAIPNAKCTTCHDGVTAVEADAHFAAGQGSTCVECHNPMNDQAPNVKHVRTSLAVFTGGAGSFVNGGNNGICQTCHTATEHHQNDGTAPSGQNHNDATVCTTCHTHPGTGAANDGFRDHEGTVTLPGTHNGQACTTCHDSGTYVDGAAIPNAKCTTCHDGVTAVEADAHFAAAQGSTCVECHNPMNDQAPNVKHVRTSLAVFTGGAGSFVNGGNNGICQTCHTATEHHQNDGTAPSGQNHNDATVCTTCHTHPGTGAANDGFRDHEGTVTLPGTHNGQACTTCHDSGTYVDGAAIPNAKCTTCHDGVTAVEADAHFAAAQGSTCVECHNPMNDQAPNVKHVRTSLAVFTGGAGSFVNGGNNGICQTCHTATEHHQNDGTAPSGQNHNDATVCTTCHTHPGTGAANDGFRDHEGTVTLPGTHNGQACTTCHDSGTYVDGAAIPNAKCTTCHDGVTAVEADAHFAAGQGSTCVECHNPMNDQAPNASHIRTSLATFLGGAGSFVNGNPNYDGICETCHTATNHHQNDGTAPGGQSHNDGLLCTSCHTHPGTATANDAFRDHTSSAVVEPPHDAASSAVFADCTVCHINAPGDFSTPVTNTECNACHGPGSPGVGTLYDYSACRTESNVTSIANGQPSSTITLNTTITDINQAFLMLDSAGGAAVENGEDHMVSGDIISTTQVQFDRTGSTGQVDISYAVVECANNEFGVESGQITLTNGTATNTANLVTTVDPARSIVIVSARTNSADTSQSPAHVTGEVIGGGTQVQVTRASAATGADTIVTYQVVEFSVNSGVTVQTGETTLGSGTSTTATVNVPDLSDAWLYFSYDASDEGPQQTAVSGQITNPTTLTFERHANNTYTNRIRWYVVTFPTGEVTVQRNSDVFSGGSTTHNIGISPVSSVNSTFTFVSNTTADTGGTGGGGGPTVNNYHVDIGNGTYGGLNVDHTSCTDMNTGQVGILVNVASFPGSWACASYRIDVDNTAGNVEGTWVFTTPYAQDTPIDSGTIWAYIDERDRDDNTVVRMELGYVSGGSFTSFGFTDVNVLGRADGTYTFDMSGATGTAPAGSVLAIRVIDLEGAGSDRYMMGTGSDSSGTIRMTVTETTAGGTTNAYPINRWTEVLSSTSNIQLTNGRGTETDSNANFEWQVVEFTGSGPVQGIGSDKNVDTHIGNQYNDPTTGSLVSLDCIECHNPMQDSSSNLTLIRDTLRSMPVVFTTRNNMADGAAPYDGVCEACHTLTSHYRNDGSSPSMPHNPGTICTDCHLHLGNGFDKDAVPDAPHDTVSFLNNCDYCHATPTDYTTPVLDSKCNECHTTNVGNLKDTNPGEFGTAPDVLTHSDAGGSGDFTFTQACIDCHDVMWSQTNIQHIRPDVNGSIDLGSIIVFTAQTNGGSFSDGAPYRDNICDTCHSDALLGYHHYDGNAPIDQDHNTNTNCAAVCHPHSVGFQPNIDPPPFPHDTQACNTCHTAEPDYAAAIDNTACMTCHDGTPAILVDTHHGTNYNDPTTSQPLNLDCVECHNPMTAQTNLSFIRDTLRGRTVVFTATSGPNSFADGDSTYDGVCEVCHTQTSHHRFDGSDATAHNDEADCTVACHLHDAGFQAPAGECVTCHNGIPAGGPGYVQRDVVGVDFTRASRHVFGGTVSNWDCIVCHREGDAVAATSGTVSTTGDHINSQVEMRNVDSENTGWIWDRTATNDAMHSDMDTFCMNCHDSDGASAIAVRSDDAGVTLTPTGAEAARPFNSSDEPSAGTLGGTVEMAGYARTSVLDVFTQFDPNNPSHHAVRAPAYSSHNSNWGNGAWVTNSLKSGQALTTVYEAAQLHCADCHTVDSADGGAHGGANGFMLQASSIDGTCYLCHNSNVYSNNSSTLTRWSHDSEGSVWGDHALIGNYNGNPGSTCLNCHGGKIGEGGSMVGYDGYGGIHGMSGTDSRSGQTKYRFQGGAYMAHDPGTAGWTGSGGTNWGCYFAGNSDQDWSTCNKHSGSVVENGSRDMAPQYSRGTPGTY